MIIYTLIGCQTKNYFLFTGKKIVYNISDDMIKYILYCSCIKGLLFKYKNFTTFTYFKHRYKQTLARRQTDLHRLPFK